MSATILQLCSRTRGRLRNPIANRPSDGDVLREVCSHARVVSKHRRNTGKAWDYRSLLLTVEGGEGEYLITESSFGKPFSVLTRDDNNPAHIQRLIPFFEPENVNFDWNLPSDAGYYLYPTADGSLHSAQRVAFYWNKGKPYVKFNPIPQYPCDYEIYFTPTDPVSGLALTSSLPHDEDSDLIEIRAARSLLPFAEWSDNEETNQSRRKELGITLTTDESLQARQFEVDVLTTHTSPISTRWTAPE